MSQCFEEKLNCHLQVVQEVIAAAIVVIIYLKVKIKVKI